MKTLSPMTKFLLPIVTATTLLITPLAASAAVEMILELDGIQGEHIDNNGKSVGAIDVLAWSNGLSQSGTFHSGGGAGKANFQDLSITKYLDSASPYLMLHTSNGAHIKSATLTIRKAGEIKHDYFKVELTKVMVTSVSSGGGDGDDKLTENISLNYAEITWTYYPYDNRGIQGTPIVVGWNVAKNTSL
jgi:type VI secretion system secreted protein Hcp